MAVIRRPGSGWSPINLNEAVPVEVNRGVSLTGGLVAAYLPSTPSRWNDLAGAGAPAVVPTTSTPTPNAVGTMAKLPGTTTITLSSISECTMLVRFASYATSGATLGIFDCFGIRPYLSAGSTSPTNIVVDRHGVGTVYTFASQYAAAGRASTIGLSIKGTTVSLFKDGALDGTATTSNGFANVYLSGLAEGFSTTIGFQYVYLWNRALTSDEAIAVMTAPFGLFRPVVRRQFYMPAPAGGGSTVFFTGLGRSVGAGRTTNTQSTAIRAATSAGARLTAAQSPSAAIVGRTNALATGRTLASPVAPLVARTQADAAGRAIASPSAPLTARTEALAPSKAALGLAAPVVARAEGTPSGRANTGLTAPLASKTQAGARGQAVAGGVSQLSGSARTQGASAGRATGSAATSLSGRTAGATGGKAAAASSAPLSGKTQAGSRASATAGGVSQLSGLARTAGLAAGRAAPSLGTTVAGRARGNAAAKASPSPSAAVSAKTQSGARGQGFAGGVSLLFGSASTTGAAAGRAALSPGIVLAGKAAAKARGIAGLGATSPLSAAGATRGRAAGRAAITVSAALTASTISRGAMRNGLAAGTALVAVTRSWAFGHAINGDQNPLFFDIGRVATIPADSRFAILPVDIRAVTISGST